MRLIFFLDSRCADVASGSGLISFDYAFLFIGCREHSEKIMKGAVYFADGLLTEKLQMYTVVMDCLEASPAPYLMEWSEHAEETLGPCSYRSPERVRCLTWADAVAGDSRSSARVPGRRHIQMLNQGER